MAQINSIQKVQVTLKLKKNVHNWFGDTAV